DLPAAQATIRADYLSVVDTRMCTVVGNEHGARVGTIEHLMAALAGCEIDNALIQINGPEVPAMDGSAEPFVFLVECAGIIEQAAPRRAIEILRPIASGSDDNYATLAPAAGTILSFEIDFENPVVARQEICVALNQDAFKTEISRARTFGFERDVSALRA